MKQPSRILPLISFAVLLAALPLAFFAAERRYYRLDNYLAAHPAQEAVLFSLEETLFTGDTALLELSLPDELGQYAEIRYTTDGSTPTAHSTLYTGPILLDASGGRKCFPVQAVAVQDGRQSGVCARTYFPAGTAAFGEDVLIVSLTCEPEDLYSQETGILALGAATQEEADSDPTLPLNFNGTARANYYGRGAEWERPVTVEIYDSGGGLLLSQKAGIRVTGGASRENGQKSLRLYARASYDEQNPKFSSAVLFGTETSADGSGTPVTEYNHLDLRSGGNDWPFTMLGDATMRALAAEAGLAPVGQCRPAAVYLNGAFYGVA